MILFSITSAIAQSNTKDVTKFLGIPIDGTKTSMIQKLKAKGFTYDAQKDRLKGEFNGKNVYLFVVTNNNKVYRIVVDDVTPTDESNIKINFNRLCRQFEKNDKYMPADLVGNFELSDEENISYEMMVHNKRFQAAYYQVSPTDFDSTAMVSYVQTEILAKYSAEELENADEELQRKIYDETLDLGLDYIIDKVSHKSVWFMITENYGKYSITMFYDNRLNKANGEDL
ncbi:MAG: hypothetical protein IJ759_01190 [Bacteroidales bacterium]|nr:hypothetical protein [Bacteroidales bacterium]